MTLQEQVLISLNIKGDAKLRKIEGAVSKLGYNLRLAGRDLMRMGGSLQRFGATLSSVAAGVFKASDIVQDAFGDIGYALEDAFEVIGLLEPFVEILEKIAEIVEENPWIAWGIALAAIAGIFLTVLGKIMVFSGWMKLLTGAVLSAKDAGMSLGETIYWVTMALAGQGEVLRQQLIYETALNAQLTKKKKVYQELGFSLESQKAWIKKMGPQYQTQLSYLNKVDKETTALSNDLLKQARHAGIASGGFTNLAQSLKGTVGRGRKVGGTFKSMIGYGLGLVSIFLLMGPLMETLQPLFEGLADAGEMVLDPLTPLIESFADLVEENPMLVAGLLGLLAAILSFGKIKAAWEGIKDFVGWLKDMPDHIRSVKDGIVSLGGKLKTLTSKFKGVLEKGWDWVKNLGPKMLKMLSQHGIGWTSLAAGVAGAVGGFLLGITAGRMLIDAFGPLGGVIMPLIGVVMALTAAILALHGTISWGVAVPVLLAAVGTAIGGVMAYKSDLMAMASFQGLKRPVTFGAETAAVLHPGETLLPAGGYKGYTPKEEPLPITVDVTGASSMEEIIRRAVEASASQISERMERRFRSSEY